MWYVVVKKVVGVLYGDSFSECSDSRTGEVRGRMPVRRMARRARVRRVRARVREKYISRSGGTSQCGACGIAERAIVPVGFRASGESIVTINLGEARRGSAWRESQPAVAYV